MLSLLHSICPPEKRWSKFFIDVFNKPPLAYSKFSYDIPSTRPSQLTLSQFSISGNDRDICNNVTKDKGVLQIPFMGHLSPALV
jgi:hypothetical protein